MMPPKTRYCNPGLFLLLLLSITPAFAQLQIKNSIQNPLLTITDNGLLGIGITAPTASFHAMGTVRLGGPLGTGSLTDQLLVRNGTSDVRTLDWPTGLTDGDDYVDAVSVTGASTKTITLERSGSLSNLSATWNELWQRNGTALSPAIITDRVAIGTTGFMALEQVRLHKNEAASTLLLSSTQGSVTNWGVVQNWNNITRLFGNEMILIVSDEGNDHPDDNAPSIVFACNSAEVSPSMKNLMTLAEDQSLAMGNGASCTAGGKWTDASSRTLKQDIQPLSAQAALTTVMNLDPVTFSYKNTPNDLCVGFIAEEVPDLVSSPDRNGMSAMDIVAVVTKVVQAQQKQITALEQEIQALKQRK